MRERQVEGRYGVEGDWKRIVIEVGPLQFTGSSRAEVLEWERRTRRQLDEMARALLAVGPRSKTVRSRIELALEER